MCARVLTWQMRTRQKGSFGLVSTLNCRPREENDDDIKLDWYREEKNDVRKGSREGPNAVVGGFCLAGRLNGWTMRQLPGAVPDEKKEGNNG